MGRSRRRCAAMEYWVNASVSLLRTFVASVSWVCVGGVSGSLSLCQKLDYEYVTTLDSY